MESTVVVYDEEGRPGRVNISSAVNLGISERESPSRMCSATPRLPSLMWNERSKRG